jgi:S-adenosylmethionine synthetase
VTCNESVGEGHPDKVCDTILGAVLEVFSFKPADIVSQLKLLRPIYSASTNYGHFGKEDCDLPWEKTNKVAALKKALPAQPNC